MGHNDLDLAAVEHLGDVELMAGLDGLVQQDRALTARLLLHLGEVEARGLYRDRGFSSMFVYAVEAHHMSPDEAYLRLKAAKLAREFPLVLQMLERNQLHLSAIKLLADHLTQSNHVELLERARSRSKREVELLVAELAPKPDVPSVVRKLPEPRVSVRVMPVPAVEPAPSAPAVRELCLKAPAQVTTPLSPGRYKVQFTATQSLHDKLQQLKDLMRHQIPDGDLCVIVERAAELLIEQQMKQRFAQTKKPRSTAATLEAKPPSRHIPRAVVREVYARDAGVCTFVSPEGRRCAARGAAKQIPLGCYLELHHEDPYGRGGPPTVQNLRLLCAAKQTPLGCRAHNALMAERDFGRDFMRDKRTRVRAGTERSAQERLGPEQGSQLDPCSRTQLRSALTDKHLKAQREAE